jgi:hypothetical protein
VIMVAPGFSDPTGGPSDSTNPLHHDLSRPPFQPPPGARWNLSGQQYYSVSEAACAVLMQQYIPGFQIVPGRTFQVPIGRSPGGYQLSADFYVEGVLFEYHPPRRAGGWNELGDFSSRCEQREYYRTRLGLRGEELHRYCDQVDSRLGEHYVQKRLRQIASGPMAGTELVHAASPREFYDRIILRFSPNPPDLATFVEEFDGVFDQVREIRNGRRGGSRRADPRGGDLAA